MFRNNTKLQWWTFVCSRMFHSNESRNSPDFLLSFYSPPADKTAPAAIHRSRSRNRRCWWQSMWAIASWWIEPSSWPSFPTNFLRRTTPTAFTILCLDDSRVTNRLRRVASGTTNTRIDRSSTDRWSFSLTLITDLSLQTTSVRERVTAAHVRSRFVSKRLWLDYPRNQLLFNKGIFGKQRKRQRGRTKQGQRSNDTHSTSLPRF